MEAEVPGSSEEHRIGAQLLVVASLSHLNYVLIRRGRDRGEDTKQWRVNVRLAPPRRLHEVTTSSGTSLGDALLRAYERLRQHDPCGRCSRVTGSPPIVSGLVDPTKFPFPFRGPGVVYHEAPR